MSLKKKSIFTLCLLLCLGLAACGAQKNTTTSKKETKTEHKTSKIKKKVSSSSSSVTPDPKASERPWTYDHDVYDAGIETYRFTKWEVRDSSQKDKKALVLYCDVTNNSTKEQDPSNVFMVVHAFQKNETSDVQLDPGTVSLDNNGNNPLQKYDDGLHNMLLPGKTVKAVMVFTLNNDKPVRVTFEDPEFNVIGVKNYNVADKMK
ncbi:DUF5067 domain-containing protein [Ligilactobacillus saerimneri]|uniref:Prophage protein n=1 Tax=Ligilactobacillus saerimneri 30a TaxID=1227363 RepID=M5J5G4_9LACO|nr:DUF5067 domain-containing protein [Ligilactobacillus saerimneri]EKW99526.1 prophage protein [Ligilactobacillus saerimneri 30a]